MNQQQLRNILDLAFRDRAPDEYERMSHQGELTTYLDTLIGEAMASISAGKDRIPNELIGLTDPMQRVQRAEMIAKTAEEVAVSQTIEVLPLEAVAHETELDKPMTLEELTGDYWRNRLMNEKSDQ